MTPNGVFDRQAFHSCQQFRNGTMRQNILMHKALHPPDFLLRFRPLNRALAKRSPMRRSFETKRKRFSRHLLLHLSFSCFSLTFPSEHRFFASRGASPPRRRRTSRRWRSTWRSTRGFYRAEAASDRYVARTPAVKFKRRARTGPSVNPLCSFRVAPASAQWSPKKRTLLCFVSSIYELIEQKQRAGNISQLEDFTLDFWNSFVAGRNDIYLNRNDIY